MGSMELENCHHPNFEPGQWPTCCERCGICGRNIPVDRFSQHRASCGLNGQAAEHRFVVDGAMIDGPHPAVVY